MYTAEENLQVIDLYTETVEECIQKAEEFFYECFCSPEINRGAPLDWVSSRFNTGFEWVLYFLPRFYSRGEEFVTEVSRLRQLSKKAFQSLLTKKRQQDYLRMM